MRRQLDNGRYAPYQIAGKIHKVVGVEITRPADTVIYTALDAVNDSTTAPTPMEFADITKGDGGGGRIKRVSVQTDQTANTSQFRVHIFNATATPPNDNAAMTRPYAAKGKFIATVSLAAAVLGRAEAMVDIPFDLPNSTDSLFAYLETIDGFTPASGQKFYTELAIELD